MEIFFVNYFSRQAIQLYRHSLSEHDKQKWFKCSHFLFLVKKNSLISQNFRFLKNISAQG